MRNQLGVLQPFLSVANASFRLGDQLVFEGTNWVFHRHQHWAVLGANGSGKSLFADMLRGRLPLVQGELRYHFQPPPGLSAQEAIGHVSFEQRKAQLHGTVVQSRWNSFESEHAASVRDFLSYERVMEINPFEVQNHLSARAQFLQRQHRAVRILRLSALMPRKLLSLSNGERQRVELARALCHPLRLLILDEPYTGLDAANRAQFHRVLEQLMATSVRVLLLTTRVEDLPAHITHVMRIDGCRIIEAGPRREAGLHGPPRRRSPIRIGRSSQRARAAPGLSERRPVVQLRNLTVRYGTNVILRRFNWTVYQGESCALLGPNGSGKSTLLSLIYGDNPQAYQNEVVVFGKQRGSGESIWELKQQIGVISPELQLHFDDSITAFDAVASGFHDTIGLFEPPTHSQRASARRWLDRFDLRPLADCPLSALSAGQQRMALLARALVKGPRLLLLDEPCQGLDKDHRDLFINAADALIGSASFTAIYVTHRPEEIPPSIKKIKRLSITGAGSRRRRVG